MPFPTLSSPMGSLQRRDPRRSVATYLASIMGIECMLSPTPLRLVVSRHLESLEESSLATARKKHVLL